MTSTQVVETSFNVNNNSFLELHYKPNRILILLGSNHLQRQQNVQFKDPVGQLFSN